MTIKSALLLAGFVATSSAVIASDAQQRSTRAPVDFTGVWMPTAIAPNGERNQVRPPTLPLLPQAQAAVDAFKASYIPQLDDAGRNCLPYGMPHQMLLVAQYPLEIVQTGNRLTVIFELHNDVRRIYLDGRRHTSDLLRTWFGHSIGHWQDNELVIETVGVRELGPPRPQSPALKITEHLRLIPGTKRGEMMEVKMIIDDPLSYSAAYTAINYYVKVPDTQMGEYFCSEDIWNQIVTGDAGPIPWR